MKKILNLIVVLVMCCLCLTLNFKVLAEDEQINIAADCGESHYEVSELVESNTLRFGVKHEKYISFSSSGLSGFNAAGSGGGGENVPDQLYPQSVNVLNVPTNRGVKIVNWVKNTSYGWARGTVKEIASDFEAKNPGWTVIAAVNGDFFDIKSNNALPETTTGSIIENGDVLKTVGSCVVAFTNGNDERPLIGDTPISFTDYFVLSLYDEEGQIVKEYQIDNVNPNELKEGLSLYYSYPTLVNGGGVSAERKYSEATIPNGGYLVAAPERCIPYSGGNDGSFFGKGSVIALESDTKITYTQFGVYSDNQEISEEIASATKIRVQRNVVGEYANADNVSGTGDTLVRDGQPVVYNDKNRHPRTMIGVKEDGTLVLVTVDGRQPNKEMYGMTTDEMSALMYAHGCVAAYNMDGGGSTTVLIRENGKLEVKNSPSDGNERRDANAILVVIPNIELTVSDVLDTSMVINKPVTLSDVQANNIKVTINEKTYDLVDQLTITELEPKKEYTITYTYDRTYKGYTENVEGDPIKVKMGKVIPTVDKLKFDYDKINKSLTVKYSFIDPDETISSIIVVYKDKNVMASLENNKVVLNNIETFDYQSLKCIVNYNIESETEIENLQQEYNHRDFKPVLSVEGCNAGIYVSTMLISVFGLAYVVIKRK